MAQRHDYSLTFYRGGKEKFKLKLDRKTYFDMLSSLFTVYTDYDESRLEAFDHLICCNTSVDLAGVDIWANHFRTSATSCTFPPLDKSE